jgi:cell division protein FtsA
VNVHVVTCDRALSQSLINATNSAQLRVRKVALQSLASGAAVLTPDEKELGSAVIDIGGGTTDLALFERNSIRFTSVLPVGGAHFTRDLVDGVRTPPEEAERIKKEFGTVLPERIAADEVINIRGLGTRGARDFPRKVVCEYLRDRGVELLELLKSQLLHSGVHDRLLAGAVLTGGGSMLEGMLELAGQILEMPVRLGLPRGLDGLTEEVAHPLYAGAIGLAILGAQDRNGWKKPRSNSNLTQSLVNRIMSWIGD